MEPQGLQATCSSRQNALKSHQHQDTPGPSWVPTEVRTCTAVLACRLAGLTVQRLGAVCNLLTSAGPCRLAEPGLWPGVGGLGRKAVWSPAPEFKAMCCGCSVEPCAWGVSPSWSGPWGAEMWVTEPEFLRISPGRFAVTFRMQHASAVPPEHRHPVLLV